MQRKVLDTELVNIYETETEYQIVIRMSQGGLLEHEPFPKDLRGLIAALQLATEVCAGKFFPRRALTYAQKDAAPQIERQVLKISKQDS